LAGGRLLTAARNFFPHPQLSVEPAGVGTFCSLGWGERPREPSLVQSDAPRPAREDQPSPSYGATGARPTKLYHYRIPAGKKTSGQSVLFSQATMGSRILQNGNRILRMA
jgi:hypothetical protein